MNWIFTKKGPSLYLTRKYHMISVKSSSCHKLVILLIILHLKRLLALVIVLGDRGIVPVVLLFSQRVQASHSDT